MSKDRNYEDEEVRAIIARALEQQPKPGGVSHEDLLSIGGEVGLSSESIEKAARDVRDSRLAREARQNLVARRRRGLAVHAFVYFAVNALLFAVNALTTPGEWWALFPIMGWGLGLFFHAAFVLFAGMSERRLSREKARLQQLEGELASAQPTAERRLGVRVAGPLDQIEDPSEASSRRFEEKH